MTEFTQAISEEIWDMKYRMKNPDGSPIDVTIDDTHRRVATALASVEKTPELQTEYTDKFFRLLKDFRFLPAGRITAGAGTGRNVTLMNCFVMGTIPDSMNGIFEELKKSALTMQQGGGIGMDFSTIRPKGSLVRGVSSDASGPLPFMDSWNAMCGTIMSAGSRRGAMMGVLRCDHPDIFDFIEAKRDKTKLRNFNLSVLATDSFMKAVQEDLPWNLVHEQPPQIALPVTDSNGKYIYRTIQARELWEAIMRNTYDMADPGIIFIDRINELNNLRAIETISATNPCGEQPLGPYSSCLLGSQNLMAFVNNPFIREEASLDLAALQASVRLSVRALDNVNDLTNFPLEEQREIAQKYRRVGISTTGVADALFALGIRYGSPKAVAWVEEIKEFIAVNAYLESCALAQLKGPYPAFDAGDVLAEGTFASTLPSWVKKEIRKYGLRNSHLLSDAPSGTISLFANNISSGIEPIFSPAYTRSITLPDGSKKTQRIVDNAVKVYEEMHGADVKMPDYFVTTNDITPAEHIAMQAASQKWVDSAVSKTVNLPEDIDYETFKDVYMLAYNSGCKGCTTFRPNDFTGSILTDDSKPKKEKEEQKELPNTISGELILDNVIPESQPIKKPTPRPEVLDSKTYKIKWPQDEHALYVTISDIEIDGHLKPHEIFVQSKSMDHFSWVTALTRMISAVFRQAEYGGDASFVVEELCAVFDPRGGAFMNRKFVPSVIAAIGLVIERHMKAIGYIENPDLNIEASVQETVSIVEEPKIQTGNQPYCPKCRSTNITVSGGCPVCLDCGHSKCG